MRTVAHFDRCKAAGLYCAVCEKVFLRKNDLHNHNLVMHEDTPVTAGASTGANVHVSAHGNPDSSSNSSNSNTAQVPFQSTSYCDVCKRNLSGASAYLHKRTVVHFNQCKAAGLYCAACDKAFMSKEELGDHRAGGCGPVKTAFAVTAATTETDPGDFQPSTQLYCAACQCTLTAAFVYAHCHMASHYQRCKAAGLDCALCGKVFMDREELQRHNAMVHCPKSEKSKYPARNPGDACKLCNVEFFEPGDRERHWRTLTHREVCKQLGLFCSLCLRVFLNQEELLYHNALVHGPKSESPSRERPARKCIGTCKPCNVDFLEFGESERHWGTAAHIKTCKLDGLFCPECQKTFSDQEDLRRHKAAVHPKRTGACKMCKVYFFETGESKRHRRTAEHIEMCKQNDSFCSTCQKAFLGPKQLASHVLRTHDPNRATEFRCCECDTPFTSNTSLKKHIRTHAPKKQFHCLPCGLDFTTKLELTRHLLSKTHKPVRCRGSADCKKSFRNVAGMLQHLESGACCSHLDRRAIDAIIRAHDTTNTIIAKLPAPPPPPSISSFSPIPEHVTTTADAAVAAMPLHSLHAEPADEDDSDAEEIVYTPAASSPTQQACSRRSSFASSVGSGGVMLFTPTTSGTATPTANGILTPTFSTTTSELELEMMEVCLPETAKTCPICDKTFLTSKRLQQHFFSPVHALPIYHCPTDFLARELDIALGTVGVGHGKNKKQDSPERTFKTLSALVQHIEAGACLTGSAPGSDAWEKLIGFVDSKLTGGGLGLAGSRLMLGL